MKHPSDPVVKYLALKEVRRCIPWAKASVVLLIFTSLALACVYGDNPVQRVSFKLRGLVCLIWFWNVCVFAASAGMLAWAWLMDRFPGKSRPLK